MLSKLKVVCALEAEALLKEPARRKHWVHPVFYQNIQKYDERFFLLTPYLATSRTLFHQFQPMISHYSFYQNILLHSFPKVLALHLRTE